MERINDGRAEWRSHQALRRRALETLIEEHELPALTTAERDDLTAVIRTLRPWPDSPAALAALGAVARTVALSNADLAELVALSRNADLRWHGVLSAEFARAYKPHRSVYRSALRLLQLDPARTMMVAAHPWDLRAAAELGMRTAYIARPGAERPSIDDRFTLLAGDLADLHAQLVAAH
jgi:2-haloacid dehalogenase